MRSAEEEPGGEQPPDPPAAGTPEASRISLAPLLASVAEARATVTSVAARSGVDEAIAADAVLVTSELVTNAVLHARTPIDLVVRVGNGTVRVEVSDGSDQPVQPPEPPATPAPVTDIFDEPLLDDLEDLIDGLSTTGRGIELVGALCTSWGVTPDVHRGGKTVWAVIGDAGGDAGAGAMAVEPATWPAPTQPVRLVAVPLRLAIESDHQFDDALRELQVIAMSGAADDDIVDLATRASELRDLFRPVRLLNQDAARAARDRGDRLVDLHLSLPDDVRERLEHLEALLSEIGRARNAGRLLVMAPSSEVVAFRIWYRDEVLRQSAGGRLEPCPFPVVRNASDPAAPSGQLNARRLELLERLRSDLAGASDPASIAAATVRRVAADMGATFVNFLLREPDGGHVSMVDRVGYAPDDPHGRRYAITHDNPISEAVRTARPIVLRTHDERLDRYPHLVPSAPIAANPTAVWIPFGDRPPAAGALVVGFSRARDFTDADLLFLLQVGLAVRDRLA